MKNQNQVRKNGSAPRAARQAKTPPVKIVTVVFFCPKDGRELVRVDFPEFFYAAIVAAAKKRRITVEQFFHRAIESKLAREVAA